MKTLKILLTILLTLVLVVVGFAAEILAVADVSVFNPWFYETALNQMGFYENIRVLLLNRIDYALQQKQSLPEDFRDDAFELAENVFTKKKFSQQLGDFLGGSLEYVLTGKGDATIPLYGWTQDLNKELDESPLIEDIINYEIEIGEIDEADKDQYYTPYKNMLLSAYTGFMGTYGAILSSTEHLSDLIKMFAPTKQLQDSLEGRFWIISYWVNRANMAAYIGLAVVVLMAALLFVVWKKNVGVAFRLLGIILIVNAAFFILLGVGLLLSITIAGLLNAIPSSVLPYLSMIQSLVTPVALVALGTGIIILAFGIILAVVGGALIRKKIEVKAPSEALDDTKTPEVSEIDYTAEPELADVELISEDESEPLETESEPDEEEDK